jgi:hypothetical protein
LEEHVAALEENFANLDKEVEEHRVELDKAISDLGDELRETRAEFELQRQEREEKEKEFLRASVSLQWWGIGLFVAGTFSAGSPTWSAALDHCLRKAGVPQPCHSHATEQPDSAGASRTRMQLRGTPQTALASQI